MKKECGKYTSSQKRAKLLRRGFQSGGLLYGAANGVKHSGRVDVEYRHLMKMGEQVTLQNEQAINQVKRWKEMSSAFDKYCKEKGEERQRGVVPLFFLCVGGSSYESWPTARGTYLSCVGPLYLKGFFIRSGTMARRIAVPPGMPLVVLLRARK